MHFVPNFKKTVLLLQTTTETTRTTTAVAEVTSVYMETTPVTDAVTTAVEMVAWPNMANAKDVLEELEVHNNTLGGIIEELKEMGASILHPTNASSEFLDTKSDGLQRDGGLFCDARQSIVWVVLLVVCMILTGENRG